MLGVCVKISEQYPHIICVLFVDEVGQGIWCKLCLSQEGQLPHHQHAAVDMHTLHPARATVDATSTYASVQSKTK